MSTRQMQRPAAGAITRAIFPTVIGAKGDEPTIIISTGSLDRQGDELVPTGAALDAYRKNPVVLFAHDHNELPVGSTTSISVDASGIRAAWKWLENDARAARVRNAYDQNVLGAASVGFVPLAWEDLDGGGLRFTKWELLEWSLCPVPANPEAIRVLKGLGLDSPASRAGLVSARRADAFVRRVRRAATALEKSGRVLSAANEQTLRAAIAQIESVLAQLDATDGKQLIVDGEPIGDDDNLEDALASISERELNDIIVKVITEQLMGVTGRVL